MSEPDNLDPSTSTPPTDRGSDGVPAEATTAPVPGTPSRETPSRETPSRETPSGSEARRDFSPWAIGAAAVGAVLAAVALVAAFGGGAGAGSGSPDVAALEFLTTDGSTATLADFEGEPLVVNFFASWCAPCRAEMPDLEATHLARGDSVTFLGVNHDLDELTWRSFVKETDVTYETVYQPDAEIFTALEAKGMPSTAFVSPDGEVLHLYTGLLTADALDRLIDEHLIGA